MSRGYSRRAVLAATTVATGAALGPSRVLGQEGDPCDEVDALKAEIDELETELADLESLIDELPDRKEALYTEILTLHQELDGPTFDAGVRSRAEAVAEEVRDSVVILDVDIGEFVEASATAWLVEEGYLLTNAHNVDESPEELSCMSIEGEQYEAAVVDAVDDQTPDVALLETDFDGDPLPTGASDLSPGDHTIQVGHPGDFGFWVVSLGEFVRFENDNELVTTNPGLEGNSGSPIFDEDGLVVAMTYAGTGDIPPMEPHDDEPRIGLLATGDDTAAVPIETALAKMEEWR